SQRMPKLFFPYLAVVPSDLLKLFPFGEEGLFPPTDWSQLFTSEGSSTAFLRFASINTQVISASQARSPLELNAFWPTTLRFVPERIGSEMIFTCSSNFSSLR